MSTRMYKSYTMQMTRVVKSILNSLNRIVHLARRIQSINLYIAYAQIALHSYTQADQM